MSGATVSVGKCTNLERQSELYKLLIEYHNWNKNKAKKELQNGSKTDIKLEYHVSRRARKDLNCIQNSSSDCCSFVARSGGKIVGCVFLVRVSDTVGEIRRLYVQPSNRNKGVGRALMKEVVNTGINQEYTKLILSTGPYMNRAQCLYSKLGFKQISPENLCVSADSELVGVKKSIKQKWRYMQLIVSR